MVLLLVAACGKAQEPAQPTSGAAGGGASTDAGAQDGVQVLYDRGTAVPREIEVDDTYVYWTETNADGSQILRAPKDGKGTSEIVGEWYAYDVSGRILAVGDTSIYWRYDTQIRVRRKDDGSISMLSVGPDHPNGGFVIDRSTLYLADANCTTFGWIDSSSGKASFIAIPNGGQDIGGVTGIGQDTEDVFCSHGKFVHAMSKNTHNIYDLATGQDAAGPVVSDGAQVYWVNNRPVLGTHEENLASISKNGGIVENLGSIGYGVGVLRLDAIRKSLYMALGAGLVTAILSYHLDTNQFTTVAANQTPRGGLADDANYVYWTSWNAKTLKSAIMRTHKP